MKHARQRGVALLVAIVMFAIATTVAAAITYNKACWRRAAASFTLEQALQEPWPRHSPPSRSKMTPRTQDDADNLGRSRLAGKSSGHLDPGADQSDRVSISIRWSSGKDHRTTVRHEPGTVRCFASCWNADRPELRRLAGGLDRHRHRAAATQGGEDTLSHRAPPYRPPNVHLHRRSLRCRGLTAHTHC